MKIDFDNYEYKEIVKDILNNREFKKIELCPHHKIKDLFILKEYLIILIKYVRN